MDPLLSPARWRLMRLRLCIRGRQSLMSLFLPPAMSLCLSTSIMLASVACERYRKDHLFTTRDKPQEKAIGISISMSHHRVPNGQPRTGSD